MKDKLKIAIENYIAELESVIDNIDDEDLAQTRDGMRLVLSDIKVILEQN